MEADLTQGSDSGADRTLVRGVIRAICLVAFAALVYLVVVAGVGALLSPGRGPNVALSLLATALVGVGYGRVASTADQLTARIVHGGRSSPSEVVQSFATRVSTLTDERSLVDVARFTVGATRAERAEVWLRIRNELVLEASWPPHHREVPHAELPDADASVRIAGLDVAVASVHGGEIIGALGIAKRKGEIVDAIDKAIVRDLGAQVAVVLRNVRLEADLRERLADITERARDIRASRQQIVEAQDAERKQLERNIHDGAQQHLVALAVRLGLARSLVDRGDEARSVTALQETERMVDEAIAVLRDFSRGLYARELAELGLERALRGRIAELPLEASIRFDGVGRYGPGVEEAVYFCCLEALQNVIKHAEATRVDVRIVDDGQQLTFAVTDDGHGFAPQTRAGGIGLRNIHDRLDVLGGGIDVVSHPGRGTRIIGRLPLRSDT